MGSVFRCDRGLYPLNGSGISVQTDNFVQYGSKAGGLLDPLISTVAILNKKVPSFAYGESPYKLRYPDEPKVQKPLQQVVKLFVDAQLFIISHLRAVDKSEYTANLN